MLKRTGENLRRVGFEVEIYVEGYRPSKDTWLHASYPFDTIHEAEAFYEKVISANWKEKEELLGLEDPGDGTYGRTVDDVKVMEYASNGDIYRLSQ